MEKINNINDPELQYGKSITSAGDALHPVRLSQLYRGVSRPKQEFKDKIVQLRAVKAMSLDRYKMMKKYLPYFVCGKFHPKVRKRDNFVSISCFVLDLDHLSEMNVNKDVVADKLKVIPEVKMAFTSPSDDGMKVLFLLDEICTDSALFSTFYKIFAAKFAQNNDLHNVVDIKTCDVSRACFMSYDPNAYWAENALPVKMEDYLNTHNFDAVEKEIKKIEKENPLFIPKKTTPEPSMDALLKIKQKLNPKFKAPKQKKHFVPPEVDEAVELLRERLPEFSMLLEETAPISYGRKIRVKTDNIWAEINVFYGKRGYSVVRTVKSGSNEELAKIAAQVFEEILFSQQKNEANGTT